jgi:acyl-CoA thioesterase
MKKMDSKIKNDITKAVGLEPFANTLGIKLVDMDTGYAVVELFYDPEKMKNLFNRAHGGAIFALIDEAFQISCQTHGDIAVALNVNVTYISSPAEKTLLRATAKEVSKTRKTGTYDIRVTDTSGSLIATCQALAYRTGKPLPF